MIPHPKILFVLADGSRARFVRRSPQTGDFVTVREVDGGDRLREVRAWAQSHPPGRSFQSAPAARSAVGPEDPYRQVKADFMEQIADAARMLAAEDATVGMVLIATRRLLPVLRRDVGPHVRVLNELGKDLTKVPDHELRPWLAPLELVPQDN